MAFWSGHKIATSLPAPLIAFLAMAIFRGLHSWGAVVQAILISLLCFLAAIGLTFIVSLFKAPRLLDDERLSVIQARDAQIRDHEAVIERLTNASLKPSRTPAEEHHYQAARTALTACGEDAKTVLRLILSSGAMRTASSHTPQPNTPPHLTQAGVLKLLESLSFGGLIIKQETPIQHHFDEQTWTVVPAMAEALKELLYVLP